MTDYGYYQDYYGDDPAKQATMNRNLAIARQNQLWNESQSRMGGQGSLEDHFRFATYGQYDPILAGQGGYTPDEQARIVRLDETGWLDQTPEERQEAYFTPEEQEGMTGDPDQERQYFDPTRQRELMADSITRQRNAAGGAINKVYSAAEDPRLRLSDEFAGDYEMTPEEAQDIETSAAQDVRDRYSAAASKLDRDAVSQGVDVFGQGAWRNRMEQNAASGAADAMTRARVAASAERAGRLKNLEEMRLGAEEDIAGRKMTAGQYAGTLGTGVERDIGGDQQGLEQDIRDFGTGQERYLDTTKTGRAGGLAEARQGAAIYNQGQRYGRGMDRNQMLSSRYSDIANARRADEQEARGWLTGQQRYAGGEYNQAANRQIQGFGTAGGLANQGTANLTDYRQGKKPGFWSRVGQGILTNVGSAFLTGGF